MRGLIWAGLALGALGLMAAEAPPHGQPPPHAKPAPPAAASATSHGASAVFHSPAGKGYSAKSRHMADCLASYPGYDPVSDRIKVKPGVTRRCGL